MADNYDDYSKEQLLRLLRERDRRPNFGLVAWGIIFLQPQVAITLSYRQPESPSK